MSSHHGILIHVVFSTKYRKPLLQDGWRDDLFGFIGATIKDHHARLLRAGGIEDHVHLLVQFHPRHAISSTIQLLKANSSRWINESGKSTRRFRWQSGYGAFSVSQSMANTVKRYVANQREHHRRHSFRDEYLALLRKHRVDFDPRYVFEDEVIA